ncbi:MAG: hypothetical protein Roseis2KO_48980 [Roseivirga sp.]
MNLRFEQTGARWTPLKSFLLRFSFLYWVFYIFPYGFEYLNWLTPDDISPWTGITQWFGESFLGWTFNPDRLAKGFDSKYDFARFMLCGALSLILATVWSFIDALKRWQYNARLNSLLRTILRYHVGFTLFLYGIAKVYLYQFGYMGLDRMDGEVGNNSPMGFLWLFMSYSPTYNIGTGLIEMVGGVLLLFRRSTLLGAIVCFVAMANVVLIDIAYDVTVKMFAIHLMLMVMVLLLDDAKRLLYVLVLNKATKASKEPSLINPKYRIPGYVLKTLLIGYILIATLQFSGEIRSGRIANQEQAVLHSKYVVDQFIINSDTLAPLRGDTTRWDQLMVGSSYSPTRMTVKDMAGGVKAYIYEADTIRKSFIFYSRRDSTDRYEMRYIQPSEKQFIMDGIHKGDSLHVEMSIFSREDYRLGGGKINWVRDL